MSNDSPEFLRGMEEVADEFKTADDGETIPLQLVWTLLGGNPAWFPRRAYVEGLLRFADECMDGEDIT